MVLRQKQEITSSAEVVDKHLILSLPNAVEPIIWRMSLDKIGTASFEIKHVKASDTYKLTLKPAKGAAETIAPFDNKEDALTALMNASDALLKPEQSNPAPANIEVQPYIQTQAGVQPVQMQKARSYKWLYLFLGLLVVIGLYSYMTSLTPITDKNFGAQTGTTTAGTPNPAAAETGVPLSADDFLSGM